MKKSLQHIILLLAAPLAQNVHATEYSAFADLLIWHTSQQTSSMWASIFSTPASHTFNYDTSNMKFDWDNGFRAGIKTNSKHFWDLSFYWTYFSAKAYENSPVGNHMIAPEFFSGFISKNSFFGADVNWHILLNSFDAEVSHAFNVARTLNVRPTIGLKVARINQTINADWDGVVYTAAELVTNNFIGVGPSFGLDLKWNLARNFNLLGDFSTAFLWGRWQLNDLYSRPDDFFGLITPTNINTNMSGSILGTMMFDYFVGFEWLYQGRSQLSLQLGYEMQYWVNQLRVTTFQQLPLHGDLTLQGATCRIQIDL